MQEQLSPKPEDYPIGKVLRKTRNFLGKSAQDYQNLLQKKAEKMGYEHLNLFKDGDRNSYSEPERKPFIRKRTERLEVICEVLDLPTDLFMRHNTSPVLGFALNSVFSEGDSAHLYCQTSMFPSDPRQMYSSEHSASSHVIEAMAHFLLISRPNGHITFVSRRSKYIGPIVVCAALLLAQNKLDKFDYKGLKGGIITECSELVAKHCVGQSGILKIPYSKEHFRGLLTRMSVSRLKDSENDITKMARRDPVTYWLVSNRNSLSGFISLSERSFLELSDFDTGLLEERFNIASNVESNDFEFISPHRKLKALIDHAKENLNLEFEEIKK